MSEGARTPFYRGIDALVALNGDVRGELGKKVGIKVIFFPKMGNIPFRWDHFIQEWGKITN